MAVSLAAIELAYAVAANKIVDQIQGRRDLYEQGRDYQTGQATMK